MDIHIHIEKRHLTFLVVLLIVVGAGFVIAGLNPMTPDPGHNVSEMQNCTNDGELLKMVNGKWDCVTENDPEVALLTANKWCQANETGTGINCSADAPSTSPSSVSVGEGLVMDNNKINLSTLAIGSCTASTQKIIWDSINKRLTCGTDRDSIGTLSCTVRSGSGSSGGATASCLSGEIRTGGGGTCSNSNLEYLGSSYATITGGLPSWTIGCFKRADGTSGTMVSAHAICCRIV
jgi:hypothetical protein